MAIVGKERKKKKRKENHSYFLHGVVFFSVSYKKHKRTVRKNESKHGRKKTRTLIFIKEFFPTYLTLFQMNPFAKYRIIKAEDIIKANIRPDHVCIN